MFSSFCVRKMPRVHKIQPVSRYTSIVSNLGARRGRYTFDYGVLRAASAISKEADVMRD